MRNDIRIAVVILVGLLESVPALGQGVTIGSYTIDTQIDSTSRNAAYTTGSDGCGHNNYYSFGIPNNPSNTAGCTVFDRDIRWMPGLPTYGSTGRQFWNASILVSSTNAGQFVNFRSLDSGGGDSGISQQTSINECLFVCTNGLQTFYNGAVQVGSFGGWRSNTNIDTWGTCNTSCGQRAAGYSQMRIRTARWQYIDDWTVVGPYSSSGITDSTGGGRSLTWGESGMYLYPAIDTSHGNVIKSGMGLNNTKTVGRVQTGDCNNANTLDFCGNANSITGCAANSAAYSAAWVYSPGGAGPKIAIGADDNSRVWVNGTLVSDNQSTCCARDAFVTAGVGFPAGWSRVLFKVHNGGGGWNGTISLRNGGDQNLNEPSVNVFDYGSFYSYGVGYEQDSWYPQVVVSNFNGAANPTNGSSHYTNSTTVTASGTANGQGPVPFWKTMQYMWGNGLSSADSNYADVTGTPNAASWSDSRTGVTGHRRFHFFAVSQSGRTSFQNSGSSGGSTYQDSGNYARYYDVYVDNAAPVNPSLAGVLPFSPTRIDLAWAIPNDQGVGVGAGSTETQGNGGNQESQNFYRRGDVGVQVYRGGSTVVSAWSSGAGGAADTGLTPNTQYTYTIEARDNTSQSRGAWNNTTGQQGSTSRYTLSVPPGTGSVTGDAGSNPGAIDWTAVGGFGAGTLQYYRYAFDTSSTYTFSGSEPQWSGGTLSTVPTSGGTWYLHVQGYNGDNVANGAFDYAIAATTPPAITTHPQNQSVCDGSTATFTVAASGTSPSYAWFKRTNAGWGSNWSVGAGGGGTFLASSTGNNSGDAACTTLSSFNDINSSANKALGIFGGGGGQSINRLLPSPLAAGQVFRIDMDNGNVESGKQNGFALQTAGGTLLLSFYFLGGQSNYKYYDGTEHDTGLGFTRNGVRVQVVPGAGNTYSLTIWRQRSTSGCTLSSAGFSGTFAALGSPGKLVLFNNNSSGGGANDLYFNTFFAGNAYDNADNYASSYIGSDKGDVAISGATSSSYTTPVNTSSNNGDQYYAIASNSAGVALSTTATLTVLSNPADPSGLIANPSTICAGGSSMLSGTAGAGGTVVQWFEGSSCSGTPLNTTGTSVSVSPTTTTSYSAWTLSASNCHSACAAGPTVTVIAESGSCNDSDACTQTDTCQSGVCTGGNPVVCTPVDQCHEAGTCDPQTGVCSAGPARTDGTTCNDGNACTQTDTCQAGVCAGSNPVVCTATDQCHDAGACNPATGVCSNPAKPDNTSCNDGDACTQNDICQAGVCTGGNAVVCTASDQCHDAGTCNPATGVCSNPEKPDNTACNDGNACTQSDTCQTGVCTGANPVTCVASDQCHDPGTCNPATGVCSDPAKPDGSSCSDGMPCTAPDTCVVGVCTAGPPVGNCCTQDSDCTNTGGCNTGACVSNQCVYTPVTDGTGCTDGNACTQIDACQSGSCIGSNPVVCTASDQCHDAGTCNPATGFCSNPAKPDNTACNDGDGCTQSDTCQSGVCTGSNPVSCPPPDQCHESGTCNPTTGVCDYPVKTDGVACNDGDACTQSDTCQTGVCTGMNPVVCTASDQCHNAGTCNPATGLCSNPEKADGSACTDGDACTQTDTCQAGVCTGSNPVVCIASDQCHNAGTCNPATGVCSNPAKPDNTVCNDGSACTQTDICQGGVCTGTDPVLCPPPDQCHEVGLCNMTTGVCEYANKSDGTACTDGNACTQSDVCQAGVCTGANPVVCTPSDQCHNAGTCNPGTGVCSNPEKPDNSACNDGNACTQTDTCQAGVCTGSNPVVCTASDACHDPGTCDTGTGICSPETPRNDLVGPVVTCPPDKTVNADAGGMTAVVDPGSASALDACDGVRSVSFVREDGQTSLSDPFDANFPGSAGTGVTKITWTATDTWGNPGQCVQKITVNPLNEVLVSVQLGGVSQATLQRCLRFEFYSCPNANPVVTKDEVLTFTNGSASGASVLVAPGTYSCVVVRDRLHTLPRTIPLSTSGGKYICDAVAAGKPLTGGNLNDDNYCDILDFGRYASQYNRVYGDPQNGNTDCSTAAPHADFSGNGHCSTEDFTFIQVNFLKAGDVRCCAAGAVLASASGGSGPVKSISVAQLKATGRSDLAVADVNADGVLDQKDVSAWMQGTRPGKPVSPRR